jgi:hypothetical protein
VTVCQVHDAIGALLPSWWRTGRASPALIQHAANVSQHWQQRNAAARKSHHKRTLKKLRKIGITLKNLVRCQWT